MEAYYSSDEEIAWGPITLREVKGDLKRPRLRRPDRRHTVSCSFQSMNSNSSSNISKTDTTEDNKLDASEKLSHITNNQCLEVSEYVSAEESSNDQLGNKNQIHDIPKIVVNEASNVDIDDSCLNFVKYSENRDTFYDIAAFKQTLVENSVGYSEEENLSHEEDQNNKYEHVSSSSTEEEVIVISDDDENDSSRYSEISGIKEIYHTDITSVKKEMSFGDYRKHYVEHNEVASEASSFSNNNNCNMPVEEPTKITDEELCNVDTYDENKDKNRSFEVPNINHSLSTINESLSNSPVIVPEIDLKQFEDTSHDNSLHLDDTLEEMNRLLRDGLNYSMPEDEIIESTPVKEPEKRLFIPNIKSGSSTSTKHLFSTSKEKPSLIPRRNFETTLSEKREMNKQSSPKYFKIPQTPVRAKLFASTPPKSHSSQLKNIVSPVALYIKNTPHVTLIQNVPQRELTKIVTTGTKQENKENFPEFPEVFYKPSKKQVFTTEKHIVIPEYMRKLNITEGQITKHEGRLKSETDTSKASKKLLGSNLTSSSIDQSLLDNTGDVSVLTNKQAFIK